MALTKSLTSLFLVSLALQGALAAPTDPKKGDMEILPFPRNSTDKFPHPHKPHVKLPGNVHKETPPVKNETEHSHKGKGKDKDRKPWAGQFGNVHKENPTKNGTDNPHKWKGKGKGGRKPHEDEGERNEPEVEKRDATTIPQIRTDKTPFRNETQHPHKPHKPHKDHKEKWGQKEKGDKHHQVEERTTVPFPKHGKNETDVPKWPHHKKPKWGKGKGENEHEHEHEDEDEE